MKFNLTIQKLIFILLIIFVIGISGCGSEKNALQRRNLMMPKKDELPRNKKYTSATKKKTYKTKHNKKNRKEKGLF